jgi:hypothetical protein
MARAWYNCGMDDQIPAGFTILYVGGSSDGSEIQANELPALGTESFLISDDVQSSERYVFESDRKFHFGGIAPPPVHDLPPEKLAAVRTRVQEITNKMESLAEELHQVCRDAGGCDAYYGLGFWVLRPDYQLFQRIADVQSEVDQSMRENVPPL